ncbi:MAG TPA: hypothetical protein VJQ85_02380 [Gaiellaceae bacterium]|nr:hypothetical protein [Gaiellaceae bacterium]
MMTPWFTPCCGLCVVLVGAAPEPPELVLELGLALEPPCAVGAAPLFVTRAPDVLPPLFGVAVAGVVPLLDGVGAPVPDAGALTGVPVPELLPEGAVYAWPATAAVDGVPPLRCEKSYAIAAPNASVAMTLIVMNTIATRSRMASPLGRDVGRRSAH